MAPNVFIAASMKSGSTHIARCFQRLGFRPASTHISLSGSYNDEHRVNATAAIALFSVGGLVIHQHTRAIGSSVAILKEFGIKPVVTIRNVEDSLVSWIEHASKGDDIRIDGGEQHVFAALHTPDWSALDDDHKWMWALYNVLPWYLSFYASWVDADIEKIFVRYEDFFEDQVAGMKRIIEHAGLDMPSDELLRKITAHRDGRFNVGVSGRGKKVPPVWAHDIIRLQIDSWGERLWELMWRDLL